MKDLVESLIAHHLRAKKYQKDVQERGLGIIGIAVLTGMMSLKSYALIRE